ncbi:unnamed protein product [Paramecium sonneborni]|uniref:Uncharacterized protein n=1 Tax=Paramecium sonneborni TaxID=65129 RepID=A0A8S1RJC1_9CILI|nr:unnamed protein product [Paramecium sonneborni]
MLNNTNFENYLFMLNDLKCIFQKQKLYIIPNKNIENVFTTQITIYSSSFIFDERFADIIQKGIKSNLSQLLNNKRKNITVCEFNLNIKVNNIIIANKVVLHIITKQGLNQLKILLQIKLSIGISILQIQDVIINSSIKQIGIIKH